MSATPGRSSLGPVFFLSYAHARSADRDEERDPDGPVMRLFKDLSKHLNELIDLDPGVDVGMVDRAMGGGEQWSDELLRGLGTCRVFVALTSRRYFRSEWCGKEWGAFEARLRTAHGDPPPSATGIIPVRWSITMRDQTPAVNRAIQEFSPSGDPERAEYRRNGLYGLLEGGRRYEGAYKYAAWQLAQRVADVYYSTTIPERIPPSAKDLPNVFLREGS